MTVTQLQIGRASRPKPGEIACGDQIAVIHEAEWVLVSVVDGLGHGPEAQSAAILACDFIRDNASMDLPKLMEELDRAIASTRGAAATLLRVFTATGRWQHVAVGNVEVSSLRRLKNHPLTIPGIVGARLRKVVETRGELLPGDVIALCTDGISRRFNLRTYCARSAQAMADGLLADWAKDHDDAGCVVIKA